MSSCCSQPTINYIKSTYRFAGYTCCSSIPSIVQKLNIYIEIIRHKYIQISSLYRNSTFCLILSLNNSWKHFVRSYLLVWDYELLSSLRPELLILFVDKLRCMTKFSYRKFITEKYILVKQFWFKICFLLTNFNKFIKFCDEVR